MLCLAYRIFLSHSFKDDTIVKEMQQSLNQPQISLYVAEADRQYGKSLPSKIEKEIDGSDAILVLVTKENGESASVNQEVGYALGRSKLVVPLVEEGAKIGVLLQGLELIAFSLTKLKEALGNINEYFRKLASEKETKGKKQDALLVVGVALAILVVIGVLVYKAAKRK